MEQILNPFGGGPVNKIVDENRKPADWWLDYLADNEPVIENEFYLLFEDGMLVKKGRSKFRTSQYIRGERFRRFKDHYENP
jgi:hypothetical protein